MSGPASVELCPEIPPDYVRLFAISERDAQQAVGLAQGRYARVADLSPLDQALTSYALGYAWLRWERLDAAEPLLAQAQARLEALGQTWLGLHVRRARLYLALLRGGDAGHADEWAALAAVYQALGDQRAAARAYLGQIVQLNVQEQAREALDLADRVEPLLEQLGAPGDQGWLWRLRGVAHVNQLQFSAALACFDKAVARFISLGQSGELAKTWLEYSNLYDRRADPVRATEYVERALPIVQRLDLPLRAAFCTKNLGWFAALRGEYDRGIQLTLQAHDQFVGLDRPDYVAGCDLNFGNIACYAGLWELGLNAYRRAEQIYGQLGRRRMALVCQRNRAQAMRMSGQAGSALQLAQELLPLARQLDEPMEEAELLLTQGQALAMLGQPAVEQDLARAEGRFRELGNRASEGECLLERGWLLLRQHRLPQARQCLRAAHELLEEQPVYQWRADHGLARCAEGRGERARASELYGRASLTVARLRQRLANEHASSGLFGQARELVDDAIRLAWRLDDAAAVLDLAELQRSLALTAILRENRVRSLAEAMPGAGIATAPADSGGLEPRRQQELQLLLEQRLRRRRPPPSLEQEAPARLDLPELRQEFARAFPAGWTLLVYVPCDGHLLTVIVEPERIALVARPFDDRLQELLARASHKRCHWMTYFTEGMETPAWPTLTALGEQLIPEQIRGRLRPDHRLLIVASGALHGLPWAALRPGGSWLVEQATPQLLPGLLIWQALLRHRSPGDDALLLGVSDFGARADELAGVRTTLDLVAARWPGRVTRLEESAVSVAGLLEQAGRGELRRYGLLHFATHGQLVAASGLFAHLKLTDADLLYDDILQLGLAGALVVLAACEGAAAEVLPGEEVLSLSRAFLAAGARDVIASTWQLYDKTAPALLDLLYAELAGGCAAPEALAQAQRLWLSRIDDNPERDALYSAPVVWASLNALGTGVVAPEP